MFCNFVFSRQHSIGYMGDGFYRSKDPTNSIKVLKEIQCSKNWDMRRQVNIQDEAACRYQAARNVRGRTIDVQLHQFPSVPPTPACQATCHKQTSTLNNMYMIVIWTQNVINMSIIVFDLITNGHAAYHRLLCFSFFFIFSLSDNKWQTKLATMLNHPITSERKGWGCKQRIMSAEERLTSYDINWIGLTMV